MVSHLLHVFDVPQLVLAVDDENGAALDAEVGDECAVLLAERAGEVIGEHSYAINSEIAAPAFLREGQIHADGEDTDIGQLGGFVFEALGLRIANGRIERGNDAEDTDAVARFSPVNFFEIGIDRFKIRGDIADLELRSGQAEGIAFEGGGSLGCTIRHRHSLARTMRCAWPKITWLRSRVMPPDLVSARVTTNPAVRSGQPIIRGTRITVWDILGWLAGDISESEILADYPELAAEDIKAALQFAYQLKDKVTQ